MTSDRRSPEMDTKLAEGLRTLFEGLGRPWAVCDMELRLVSANAAFEHFCAGQGTTVGGVLEALARVSLPGEGRSAEVEIALPRGGTVLLGVLRRGEVLGLEGRHQDTRARLGLAEQALLEQARTEGVLLDLGRSVAEATGEEELVAAVARGVKELFPGRSFCIRIIDARTGGLTSLYAEGRLKPGTRAEPLVVKPSAVERTHLPVASLPAGRVVVAPRVPLLFEDTVRGIAAPLVASGQLYGAVHLEYLAGFQADIAHDERVLLQLANQVAVAVKNAKLIDELTFVRKYLEELLENANALILVANRERRVVVFNQALERLTGFSKEEVLGRELTNFVPEGEHLRLGTVLAATLRGEPAQHFELRLLTQGGEARASFATSAVRTAQGEVEGVIAIGQDVTVVSELEKRIIHTEKLATLGQLAASVAHEINNPMTTVQGFSEALLQRSLGQPHVPPGDVDKLRKIVEASHRVLRFTRSLVAYSRPARDKPERVQLQSIIDTAVGFCEHVVTQCRVTVERDYTPLPPVSAVRNNLEQVFVNLITNACHAMRPGGRVMLVTRREGQEALVLVKDTGSGIEPRHLARVFEPFFTTKPEGKGTGLGLSIVQDIIERHGGRIRVESELGRGTTFILHLPLAQ